MSKSLYDAVNEMMAQLGTLGEISSRDAKVTAVIDALHDIDGGAWNKDYQWISVNERLPDFNLVKV